MTTPSLGDKAAVHMIVRQVAEAYGELYKEAALSKEPTTKELNLSTLEKSVISTVTGAILLMLGWTVVTINSTSKEVAVIQSQLEDVRTANKDYYTQSEHDRYADGVETRLLRLETGAK